MNYIYDILLNFNDKFYDFFDWNNKDDIVHIRKIPLLRVSAKDYKLIKNNKVKVNDNFLEKIHNKTEYFDNHKVRTMEYGLLISNGLEVFGLLFDKNGISIKYSDLLIDEFSEVIEVCLKLDESKISYNILSKYRKKEFLTRRENDIIEYLNKEIAKLDKKNTEKIKYLYYELFDEKCDDIKYIISRLKETIKNYQNKFYLKAYEIFKKVSINQK